VKHPGRTLADRYPVVVPGDTVAQNPCPAVSMPDRPAMPELGAFGRLPVSPDLADRPDVRHVAAEILRECSADAFAPKENLATAGLGDLFRRAGT
jgi:hypothetical protein